MKVARSVKVPTVGVSAVPSPGGMAFGVRGSF